MKHGDDRSVCAYKNRLHRRDCKHIAPRNRMAKGLPRVPTLWEVRSLDVCVHCMYHEDQAEKR